MRNQTNNNRHSHCDVHEIDQSKFDDSVQFEDYDSITIQFRTQLRHSNVMFDEISRTLALQRVLTDVHVKAIGNKQSNWLKCRFKIDSGAFGNLMPLNMFKLLYNRLPSSISVNSAVGLFDYNKKEIKQLGTCYVCIRFRSAVKQVHFYVIPDRLKPIIGVSDALALGLTLFHCLIYNDWQSDSHIDSVLSNNHVSGTSNGTSVGTGTGTGNGNGTHNGTDTSTRGSNGMGSSTHKGTDTLNYNTGNINNGHGTSMVHTVPGMLTKQSILTHPKYLHLFSGIGRFQCKPVHITVKSHSTPIQKPPRWVPIAMKDKFKQELDSMETQGIISKYDGHNASPEWLNSFVIVKIPNGSLHICLDPTDLNKDIVRPVCNSQTIDDMVHKLKDAKYFTVFDTSKGFFHVPLDAESKVLTAMLTSFGIYVYNVLAVGLSNTTDVFETCIREVLQGLKGCTNIADDILAYGSMCEDFKTNVLAFLDCCVQEDMHLNPDKVKLDCPEVPFFRNLLSKDGLSPDNGKVQQWPTPMNQTELQSFLGTVNYFNHFLAFLSDLCTPLQALFKKGTEFVWTTVHQHMFDQIKLHVSNDVKLQFYDANKPLYIEVDTSKKGIGAVMLQGDSTVPNTAKSDEIPMNLRPISYASKTLLSTESNYSNIECELLGLLFSITHFKHFTYGRLVHVITDHKPLVSLFRKSLVDSSPRLTRMLIQLLDSTLDVRYQPAAQMHLSDAVSRLLMHDSNTGSTIKNLDISVHAIEELRGFNSFSSKNSSAYLMGSCSAAINTAHK